MSLFGDLEVVSCQLAIGLFCLYCRVVGIMALLCAYKTCHETHRTRIQGYCLHPMYDHGYVKDMRLCFCLKALEQTRMV
jgi:hypothetical protein